MPHFPLKSILKKSSSNRSLFDDAWGRPRDPVIGYSMGLGVGTHEARHWHYRAYDLGELNCMSPAEVGHAAAYEAYRSWTTNPSMYEYGDIYRQRERLIGLAVGEAARLLAYVGQQTYKDARLTASETAAATASTIFYENREEGEGFSRGRSRSRLSSSGATYGGSYAYDNGVTAPYVSHHRSRSRPRSSSHSHPSALQGGVNMPSIPAPFAGSQYQGSVSGYPDLSPTYGTFPGNNIPLNMPTHGTPYPGTNVSLGAAASYTSHSYQPPKVQPYQGSTQPYHTQVYQSQPYQPQSLPINVPTHTTHQSHRGRSASVPYLQQSSYMGAYGNPSVAVSNPYAGYGNASVAVPIIITDIAPQVNTGAQADIAPRADIALQADTAPQADIAPQAGATDVQEV
ncbi:hypothetical protein J132_09931 [Termitomyces sp. J132]|nr:hypothetical protein J132_09931 [Termitomyces sp. J132]